LPKQSLLALVVARNVMLLWASGQQELALDKL
jgi:hypothetical protein